MGREESDWVFSDTPEGEVLIISVTAILLPKTFVNFSVNMVVYFMKTFTFAVLNPLCGLSFLGEI